MGGPWFAEGHLIGVDRWSPHFDPASLEGLSSPIWARFPGLPLHFWGDRNLGRIASMVGTPMWVDEVTATWGRTEYARVCVRVDLSASLPTGVWVEDAERRFFQPVTFEGLDQLCFRCGRAGHSREECGVSAKMGRPSAVRPDGPTPSVFAEAPQLPRESPAGSYAAAAAAIPTGVSSVQDGPEVVSDDGGWQRVERRRVRSPPRFLGGAQSGRRGGFFGRPAGRPPAGPTGQRTAPREVRRDERVGVHLGSPPRASGQLEVGGPSRFERGKQIVEPSSSKRAFSPSSDVVSPADREADDTLAIVPFGCPVQPGVVVVGARKRQKGGSSPLRSTSGSGGGAPPQPG